MKNRENDQPGAQTNAEGQYGDRAREANRERVQRGGGDDGFDPGDADPATDEQRQGRHRDGGHRIYEDRQQHDEADKNSEKNRLNRDRDRQGDTPSRPGGESR